MHYNNLIDEFTISGFPWMKLPPCFPD